VRADPLVSQMGISVSYLLKIGLLGLISRINSVKTDSATSAAEAFSRSTAVTRSAIYSMAPGLAVAFQRSVKSAHHLIAARLPVKLQQRPLLIYVSNTKTKATSDVHLHASQLQVGARTYMHQRAML
jgi:hypothetical protein